MDRKALRESIQLVDSAIRSSVSRPLSESMDSPKDAIKKAIGLLDYLPNGVSQWVKAHGGDERLADKNGKTVKQVVAMLGEVLSSIPAAVTYQVVGIPGQDEFDTREELIKAMEKIGIKYTGDSAKSGTPVRAELRGQPQFSKLLGPMYGGAGVVRYETQETYDRLSN